MARYVELRIHGVSGTSPESLLGVKQVGDPVAGDKYVRFVRPEGLDPLPEPGLPDGDPDRVLEGMSWGRLTSGSVIQATWLLLLPFALVNLAYWARPWGRAWDGTTDRVGPPVWQTDIYRWLIRVIGLSLTATIAFTAATASMDIAGWQCAIRDKQDCMAVNGWIDVTAHWGAGKVLAVAALVPVAVTLLLVLLSHRTSLRYEAFRGPLPDSPSPDDPDLFSRRMWRGDVLVGRLRTLHLAAGLAVTAAILGRAAASLDEGSADTWGSGAVALAVLALLACVALAHPRVWGQWRVTAGESDAVIAGGVVSLSVAALFAAEVAALAGNGTPGTAQGHLVGIIATGHILVLSQILVLAVLLATMLSVHLSSTERAARKAAQTAAAGDQPGQQKPGLALWGFAGWFIAALAVVLGFAYSASIVFRVADLLTGSGSKGACESCTAYATSPEPAPAFEIAAFATAIFVVILIITGGLAFLVIRRERRTQLASVRADYPDEAADLSDADYRLQRVVRPQSFAAVVSLNRVRHVIFGACAVGIAAGLYSGWDALNFPFHDEPSYQSGGAQPADALTRLYGHAPPPRLETTFTFLRDFGAWAVAGFAAGLIVLGVLAWRNEKARRIVGIIWDVTSFFPRAGHPLAPPCYAERAVPQLTCRVAHLVQTEVPGTSTTVVVAGHSQGSVLGVAALAQLARGDEAFNAHIGLLTFGCPLMRLYAPIFPRLFGAASLEALPEHPARWTNLWRPTDPVGASLQPVLVRAPSPEETPDPGDLKLHDPSMLGMDPELSAYPPVHGHVDYYADPDYHVCRQRLVTVIEDGGPRT